MCARKANVAMISFLSKGGENGAGGVAGPLCPSRSPVRPQGRLPILHRPPQLHQDTHAQHRCPVLSNAGGFHSAQKLSCRLHNGYFTSAWRDSLKTLFCVFETLSPGSRCVVSFWSDHVWCVSIVDASQVFVEL